MKIEASTPRILDVLNTEPIGVHNVPTIYRNIAIFETLIFSTKGENISKLSDAKNKHARAYCMRFVDATLIAIFLN